MRRLFWVRHGPTHAKAFAGWRDIPADLSDTAAIARLSDHLPATAVFVSSDLTRARDTADAIAAGRTRLPDRFGFREMHFGDWDGMHWRDVANRDPELSRLFWEDPGDHQAPGGESWHDLTDRIHAETDDLLKQSDAANLVIVCHMGAIMAQLQRALGCSPTEVFAHDIAPLSVTETHLARGQWQVQRINHLP